MESYNAVVKLCTRNDVGDWNFEDAKVTCTEDFQNLLGSSEVEQVRLDIFHHVIFSFNDLGAGVFAKLTDKNGELIFVGNKLLLVECDETKPVDITENALNKFRNDVQFL